MTPFRQVLGLVLGLLFLGLVHAEEDTSIDSFYDIKLADAIEVHLKGDIERMFGEEERARFYEQYYEDQNVLEGFTINKLLNMFGERRAHNSTCHMCNSVLGLARQLLTTPEMMIGLLSGLCHDSDTITARVCLGTLERLAGPLVWLFQHSPLAMEEMCSVLVGHGCLAHLNWQGSNGSIFWELPLPARKEFKPLPVSAKTKKVLHLTDIHLDLWYETGSNATCNEPLCCRATSHDPKAQVGTDGHDHGVQTGFWSEVNGDCDTPLHFVVDSLKQIAAAHPDLDAVFWTGDNVPHDVWNTTEQINLRHIHTVSRLVAVAFNGVEVFPTLGNHEAHPINLYIPESVTQKDANLSMKWLYEPLLTEYWSRWITEESAKKTFRKGGYYAKNVSPNWKVLVMNTNSGQEQNFWNVFNPHDPDGQLAWLIDELDKAEASGTFVSILGHIPPQHGLYDAWLHNYIRILDRYSHLITASFNGHTHDDEIVLLYNQEKKPFHVTYISGSLTTYSYLNPQYTIFEMDSHGFPLHSQTYMTDIADANKRYLHNSTATPIWKPEYSALKSYSLKDMTPTSWDHFLTSARDDMDLAYLYADHYHRHSAAFQRRNALNESEVQNLLKDVRMFSPFLPLDFLD